MRKLYVIVPALIAMAGCTVRGDRAGSGGGNGNAETTAAKQTAGFCEAACERAGTCDDGTDVETCTKSCENSTAVLVPKLRAEMVSETVACIKEQDCRAVLTSDFLESCFDEAAAVLGPTAKAGEVCDAWAETARRCDERLDKSRCLSGMKPYSDETLTEVAACMEKSCSAITSCISVALGLD